MKKVVGLSMLTVMLAASCNTSKSPIIGVYELEALNPNNVRLHLKKNDRFLLTDKFFERRKPYKYSGLWELKGDTLMLNFPERSLFKNEPGQEQYLMKSDSSEFCYINSDSVDACYVKDTMN